MTAVSDSDRALIRLQLGREPRGLMGVAARCKSGHPTVITTAPRLPDGAPFPTFYYLCCPEAVAQCSRLEAVGLMREAENLLREPAIAEQYRLAHLDYLTQRAHAGGNIPEIADISAGGMPYRVKCFHALVAHALARPQVNPIGEWALQRLQWSAENCKWTERTADASGSY